jgi:hypothetical protein
MDKVIGGYGGGAVDSRDKMSSSFPGSRTSRNASASIIGLSTETEHSHYAAGSIATLTAVISIKAPSSGTGDGGRSSIRPPICLSAVLDRSGSMKGKKLELVKDAASFVASRLNRQDRLGLVLYDDKVSSKHYCAVSGTVMPISLPASVSESSVSPSASAFLYNY